MVRRSSSVMPGSAAGGCRTIDVPGWPGGPTVIQRISPYPTSPLTSKPIASRQKARAASGSSCGRKLAWMAMSVLIVSPSVGWGRLRGLRRRRPARSDRLAHCPLHERADLRLFGSSQLLQREGGRPHGAFVEVRLVVEAERSVPRVELRRRCEVADDLAVLGIRGHPVPGFRREGWRAFLDDLMEPLGHGAIRLRHLGDLREHVAFPIRLLRFRLLLFGALLHRGSFLGREPLGLLCAHLSLLCRFFHVLLSGSA